MADAGKFDAEARALAGMFGAEGTHFEARFRKALAKAHAAGRREGIEASADVASAWALHYPDDVFIPPPKSTTPDAYAAAGSRNSAHRIAENIRALLAKEPTP